MIKTMKEIIDNKERLVCSSRTPSCCRTTLTEKKKRKRKRKGKERRNRKYKPLTKFYSFTVDHIFYSTNYTEHM
jgi:hypothetical protein